MNNMARAILILDDEAPVSWTLQSVLGMENYKVFTASTLEEAGPILHDEALSAVITEYRLDREYTVETIRKIKETMPGLYVMMLTNNEVNEREYEEIIRAGVDDYFLKPVSFDRILLHLEKGLKRAAC